MAKVFGKRGNTMFIGDKFKVDKENLEKILQAKDVWDLEKRVNQVLNKKKKNNNLKL